MIRTAIIYVWTITATIIFGTSAIISAFLSKSGNLPHLLARAWARSILWVSGVRVSVNGAEHIDTDRSYIYMANHQSNFDIPVLLGCLPVQFRWLAKAELFKIPLFGRAMQGCGYISIDRTNRRSAFQSLERAAKTIRDGTSVIIFPEGTRSADGKIRSFKKGGFVLTLNAGVPIVPVIISGTWAVMPRSDLRIRPGRVTLEILPPVDTSQYTRKNKELLMDRIRNLLCENFERLQGEKVCN
jgi:1-acyl-sn-glycerol-3-phosphate acyltransferase